MKKRVPKWARAWIKIITRWHTCLKFIWTYALIFSEISLSFNACLLINKSCLVLSIRACGCYFIVSEPHALQIFCAQRVELIVLTALPSKDFAKRCRALITPLHINLETKLYWAACLWKTDKSSMAASLMMTYEKCVYICAESYWCFFFAHFSAAFCLIRLYTFWEAPIQKETTVSLLSLRLYQGYTPFITKSRGQSSHFQVAVPSFIFLTNSIAWNQRWIMLNQLRATAYITGQNNVCMRNLLLIWN